MARSIRTRITMLATGVALSVSLIVCVGAYLSLRYALYREVDSFLEGEVHEFRAILIHESDDDLEEVEREIRAEIGSRSISDLVFRLLDAGGSLLITSDSNDRFPNLWSAAARAPVGVDAGVWFESIDKSLLGVPYRICSQRDHLAGRGEVIIQAAYRFDRVERSLAMTRILCLSVLVLAAVLSVLGGRAVARASMMPVIRITKIARQVSAKRLSTRVPLADTKDELDELANTLNDMLDRVERSFRQIQQFTADAAHELRTPLTALRGSAEHALGQTRSAEQLRAVIERSLDYYRLLGRVTDDLLLLARLDAGQEPLQSERFSLTKAMDDLVDLYRPLAAEHSIQLNWQPGDDHVFVVGDPGKIRRVLSNLLDNSIKYMGRAGRVDFELRHQNGTASIIISDTGPGMSREELTHVFERFYRGDAARTASGDPSKRSAGLGLAICRSVIDAHGGRIQMECPPGRGTQVTIHLASTAENISILSL